MGGQEPGEEEEMWRSAKSVLVVLFSVALFSNLGVAQLPDPLGPMPEPLENPLTGAKAILGKFLFLEEQLSSDDAVA